MNIRRVSFIARREIRRSGRRYVASLAKEVEEKEVEKRLSYNEIARGIEARSTDYLKVQGGRYAPKKNIIRNFGQVSYGDFIKAPEVGDLVLSKYSGPLVLLQIPKDNSKDFLACDASGIISGVNRSKIAFSMGNLVSPTHLYNCIEELKVDDGSVLCVNNVMKRAICPILRKLVTDKYAEWDQILPVVERQISGINKIQQTSINIPFFQLAQEVDKCIKAIRTSAESITIEAHSISNLAGKFPPPREVAAENENASSLPATLLFSLYEAVNMIFDRNIIVNSRDNVLTLLTKKEVADFDSALSDAKNSPDEVVEKLENHSEAAPSPLIKRYSLDDINQHDVYAQSATLSLLRKLSYFKDGSNRLEPSSALNLQAKLGYSDENHGPFFDSSKYDFLKNNNISSIPVSFGPLSYDRLDNVREDLGKDISVYCIDSADSHEIDDGISITQLFGAKVLIGVHIADPTSSFKDLNNDLIQNAYNKTSTAYFPPGPLTMFPTAFSNEFSLESKLGSRKCLTISFIYDEVERRVVDGSLDIRPQLVNNVVNITYNEVNELLKERKEAENDTTTTTTTTNTIHTSNLKRLLKISQSLQTSRFDNGALSFNIQRAAVKVEPDSGEETEVDNINESINDVSISLDQSLTPAHILVSELMIMANSLTASFTKQHSIPNIYRTQAIFLPTTEKRPKFSSTNNKTLSEEKSFQVLQAVKPSLLSTKPGMHQSLGVAQYCSTTSPLRRFQDIITHWQIYSHILGLPQEMLSTDQLNTVTLRLQTMQSIINSAQRKSLNYYVLKQLEKDTSKPLSCIIASQPSSAASTIQRVFLSEYGIYGSLQLNGQSLPVGKRISCRISKINSTTGQLFLSQ